MQDCPLCLSSKTILILETYSQCGECELVFLQSKYYLNPEEEKQRYLLHNNDVLDERYQKFAQPLVDSVLSHVSAAHSGLDYGAGPDSVVIYLLNKSKYLIHAYDPYFHPKEDLLKGTFDYIVSSEVIEHFYHPQTEFQQFYKRLNPGGWLFLQTEILQTDTVFANWYYRRDPTHVVFYSEKTLQWIQQKYKFTDLKIISKRIAIFKK
jgi:SAM-dependent methyltransferase